MREAPEFSDRAAMTVHRMARASRKKKIAGAKWMRQRYTNIVALNKERECGKHHMLAQG